MKLQRTVKRETGKKLKSETKQVDFQFNKSYTIEIRTRDKSVKVVGGSHKREI